MENALQSSRLPTTGELTQWTFACHCRYYFLFLSDTMGNKGAYIILNGKEMKPNFEVYEAVPHPNVKPMMYANSLMNLIM